MRPAGKVSHCACCGAAQAAGESWLRLPPRCAHDEPGSPPLCLGRAHLVHSSLSCAVLTPRGHLHFLVTKCSWRLAPHGGPGCFSALAVLRSPPRAAAPPHCPQAKDTWHSALYSKPFAKCLRAWPWDVAGGKDIGCCKEPLSTGPETPADQGGRGLGRPHQEPALQAAQASPTLVTLESSRPSLLLDRPCL